MADNCLLAGGEWFLSFFLFVKTGFSDFVFGLSGILLFINLILTLFSDWNKAVYHNVI